MISYVIKRLLGLVLAVVGAATFAFVLLHLVPGDPATAMLGQYATQETLAELRRTLGLDRPLFIQYFEWFNNLFRGNWGKSYFLDRSVMSLVKKAFPVTLSIAILALVIACIIGVCVGIFSAIHKNTVLDILCTSLCFVWVSFPSFWLGLLFMLFFSVHLRWFPAGGYIAFSSGVSGWLKSCFLPALTLGLIQSAFIARQTRGAFLIELDRDYIKTARGKGLPERIVVFKHALRNAGTVVLTVTGLVFGQLLGGAAILETVYTMPGIGYLLISAVGRRDLQVVQGVIVVSAVSYCIINFVVDLLYPILDPRIRYE